MIQPTLINLYPNEYNPEHHYYPFAVKLGKCTGSFNTLNDLSNRVCVSNKTNDLNIHVLNMITGKNQGKILTKDISCKCKCRFVEKKCSSVQWWNNNTCLCECKKRHVCDKDYTWNPATCSCQNGKCLASFMDNSAIACDEVIESYDEETNFNEKKATCKTQSFYILLITIGLLIAVSIYCYLIKCRPKQKQLLPFHDTYNEL